MTRLTKTQFCLFIFLQCQLIAPAQFSMSAELRPRTELRHGFGTLAGASTEAIALISQRSRLNFDYSQKKYELRLSLQDVRVWGDEAQLGDLPGTALHEAWGEIHFTGHFSLRAGRQELVYDDHRLFGNVDWAQQARSHDAAVFKVERGSFKFHFGAAYNNAGESFARTPYLLNNYKVLSYFWLHKEFSDKFNLSFTGVTDGFEENDTSFHVNYRHTAGPLLQYKSGPVQLGATLYYQFGKTPSRTEINAWLMAVNFSYKINKLTLGLGVDYLSGTDALDGKNHKFRTFHTLYATNHKFYGLMDYFLDLPAQTRNGGLTDVYAKASLKFSEAVSFAVDGHYFLLSNNVIVPPNPAVAIDKKLGAELDAVLDYKFLPDLNIKAGLSLMAAGSSMEILKGGDKGKPQYWGWIMLTFKPSFFTTGSSD